ncbi:VOC family protein [Varunaivibrio sulfuroxidans]|uniref:Glyoxalase/fosfomycin resistance/dioxygenase domain-containing protein n=1 Tax=Varunaivibrio sulfuroxidans TaxID=1773489 RepID=A0A4R3J6G2_9PROT|nr:VOC family protein [Varunaivibrio sulfuroxidans]TCS60952.1 hypothetical protein EDD55_109113 [Varunaivibrio sulfuroxidans]WES31642.1 hypothetical protein P3M64_04525 [Varunaivibrio sulfuroxidans]
MKVRGVLTRIFLEPSRLNETVSFYEDLLGEKCALRFEYPEKGLELARIGTFLLIAGSADRVRPFENTRVTFLVDSMEDFEKFFRNHEASGASILDTPKEVPSGVNMRVKHPDGLVAEYVELTASDRA